MEMKTRSFYSYIASVHTLLSTPMLPGTRRKKNTETPNKLLLFFPPTLLFICNTKYEDGAGVNSPYNSSPHFWPIFSQFSFK